MEGQFFSEIQGNPWTRPKSTGLWIPLFASQIFHGCVISFSNWEDPVEGQFFPEIQRNPRRGNSFCNFDGPLFYSEIFHGGVISFSNWEDPGEGLFFLGKNRGNFCVSMKAYRGVRLAQTTADYYSYSVTDRVLIQTGQVLNAADTRHGLEE